jgi:CheY-like chemotaxis protein
VQTFLGDGLWLTEGNPGDFEDALLNLAINARDAMPKGGTLIIETRNTVLESADGGTGNDIPLNEYVMISVSDSGCGMKKEVVDRIFEPFFTTKGAGKGTGLGLSLVYGFVQRSNGHIRVYSEPDSGTTIQMYLPHSRQPEKIPEIEARQDELPPRGSETVLVVDDEPDLVDFAKQTLVTLGYRVLVAGNAKEALGKIKKYPDIDILFTDVVMPGGMNGLELTEHALSQIPGLKVLMTSGFSDKIPRSNRHNHLLKSQLVKPYRRNDMARRIRQVLDHELHISFKPN